MNNIELRKRYAASYILDNILYKAANVSPLTKISRNEKKLRDYLYKSWKNEVDEVAKIAGKMAKRGDKQKKIIKFVDKSLSVWHKSIQKILIQHVKDVYELGRDIGYKKATGQIKYSLRYGLPKLDFEIKKAKEISPVFDLIDEQVIRTLEDHQLYWIGEYYDVNIADAIAKTVKETILEAGADVTTAGKLIEERIKRVGDYIAVPKGFNGTTRQYFDALSANVTTTTRVFSQLKSFQDVEINEYTISNPGDSRTCSRCALLDGKSFKVADGANQMNKIINAKSPDDIKAIQPWLSEKRFLEISERYEKIGMKAFTDDKIILPPFHFKCRCTIDISPVSMIF